MDQLTRRIATDVALLRRLVDAEQPHAPTSKDLRDVEEENRTPDPECSIMRELANTHEPALCESDLGGILPSPQPVGRWVHDFARKYGRRPSKLEATKHAQGQRVMVKA